MNAIAFTFEAALLRNWTISGSHPNDPRSNDLPEPGPRWLVRMDRRHRQQVCITWLTQQVRLHDGQKELALGKTARVRLARPARKAFIRQLDRVESWAALRSERTPEILAQLGPQHAFWSSVLNLNAETTPWTNELLGVAIAFASNIVQQVKYLAVCPRPWDYSPRIQPMIDVPGHFTWPSGHATQAFMVVEILSSLLLRGGEAHLRVWSEARQQLLRQAERIATNRVIAGLHFPIDNDAGCVLGTLLGRMVVDQAIGKDDPVKEVQSLVLKDQDDRHDFELTKPLLALGRHSPEPSGPQVEEQQQLALVENTKTGKATAVDTPLKWLWAKAHDEWHQAGQD